MMKPSNFFLVDLHGHGDGQWQKANENYIVCSLLMLYALIAWQGSVQFATTARNCTIWDFTEMYCILWRAV